MYNTVTEGEFVNVMTDSHNGFSSTGASMLFIWLEEYEEETGEKLEFDPVGIRCEFSEYASPREAWVAWVGEDQVKADLEELDSEDNDEVDQFIREKLEECYPLVLIDAVTGVTVVQED